jgi:hypothetical protein
MLDVHSTVGSLVVLAYLALTVLNGVQLARHRTIPWVRQLSMVAALLLLIQYVIGFNLLAGDYAVTPLHYIVALASLITVGVEHSRAYPEPDTDRRNRLATLATAGTLVLTVVAYIIGQSS